MAAAPDFAPVVPAMDPSRVTLKRGYDAARADNVFNLFFFEDVPLTDLVWAIEIDCGHEWLTAANLDKCFGVQRFVLAAPLHALLLAYPRLGDRLDDVYYRMLGEDCPELYATVFRNVTEYSPRCDVFLEKTVGNLDVFPFSRSDYERRVSEGWYTLRHARHIARDMFVTNWRNVTNPSTSRFMRMDRDEAALMAANLDFALSANVCETKLRNLYRQLVRHDQDAVAFLQLLSRTGLLPHLVVSAGHRTVSYHDSFAPARLTLDARNVSLYTLDVAARVAMMPRLGLAFDLVNYKPRVVIANLASASSMSFDRTVYNPESDAFYKFKVQGEDASFGREISLLKMIEQKARSLGLRSEYPRVRNCFVTDRKLVLPSGEHSANYGFVYEASTQYFNHVTSATCEPADVRAGLLRACHDLGRFFTMGVVFPHLAPTFHGRGARWEPMRHLHTTGVIGDAMLDRDECPSICATGLRDVGECAFYQELFGARYLGATKTATCNLRFFSHLVSYPVLIMLLFARARGASLRAGDTAGFMKEVFRALCEGLRVRFEEAFPEDAAFGQVAEELVCLSTDRYLLLDDPGYPFDYRSASNLMCYGYGGRYRYGPHISTPLLNLVKLCFRVIEIVSANLYGHEHQGEALGPGLRV
ncbi:ORF062 [Saltwater crocodilepox virus]|nr:ORF062 [Saltwater crocodilepox virus]QGT47790.1 ORF062 [Saltwater crocodilepox virus]QGT48001.1 ORF062 [Saltwater crocodilepox virus]QGT48214.1 ORF062 [Saltwater crocodilepox virus]QGT48430.1 ORF062 [Saltwater crocodilepox virus]